MEIINVKGTYDYLPVDQLLREQITEILRDSFKLFGFNPIETPILNMFDLLASKYGGGAEILKEVYQLTDQGNRKIGLRYDLTVPFCKVVSINLQNIQLPFKKYEIGKVFRDGPTKLGRKREFYQADVDVVGVQSYFAELEFFKLISYIANRLQLKVQVKYNNRELLVLLLSLCNISPDNAGSIILTVDKLEKFDRGYIINELKSKAMQPEDIDRFLGFLDMKFNDLIELLKYEPNVDMACLDDFIQFKSIVDKFEDNEWARFSFTPSLARGLEVYTGTIWEVFVDDSGSKVTSSIGAGGRYDKIIGKLAESNQPYPAVGMTFGLDVIYDVLKDKQRSNKFTYVNLYIIPFKGYENEALLLADELRELGICTDVDYTGVKLKKALNRANNMKVDYFSIVGEDEAQTGVVRIKNMNTGEERLFDRKSLSKIKDFIINSNPLY